MSSTMILFLQSLLITLQMINAGLATIPNMPIAVPLFSAAIVGGFQFFVQNLGNNTPPPGTLTTVVETQKAIPAGLTTTTTSKTETVAPSEPPKG
jgi:hypothetical protein